jgi:cation diffusion facilitator CzcD-associated flavoprotein CzcO
MRQPTIAVIGAGVAGIAAVVKLTRTGFTDVTVFERSPGPGGTWLHNDYPGCEVDIHSYLYSFSFMPWVWSRTHAKQPEADGVEYHVDVLVMATGFRAQDYLSTLDVRGAGGQRLHELWGDTPRAMAGVTVPGFPNFFIIYGPNTNGGGSIIFQLERGVDLAVRALRRVRRNARAVDTRPSAFRRYTAWLDRTNDVRLTAQTKCNNYYLSASGRTVTQWPLAHGAYWRATWLWGLLGLRRHR